MPRRNSGIVDCDCSRGPLQRTFRWIDGHCLSRFAEVFQVEFDGFASIRQSLVVGPPPCVASLQRRTESVICLLTVLDPVLFHDDFENVGLHSGYLLPVNFPDLSLPRPAAPPGTPPAGCPRGRCASCASCLLSASPA